MLVTTKIGIDLQRPSYPAVINAVQGDQNTRCLEISLYSGGVAWQVPEDVTVAVRYCKPDKAKGYYDTMPDGSSAFSVSGNTVSILLVPQMLTVPGSVSAQVVLFQGAGILSTFCIQIHVEADPSAGVMESEDYINWLQWVESELDKYLEQLKVNGEFVGGSIVGSINMNGNPVYGLPAPTADDHAANKGYVDSVDAKIPQHYHNWQYFWVDASVTTDGDGSENAPFQSIDRAFEKANEGWVNLRIYVKTPGTYLFSKRAFIGMALHIENTSTGAVILQQISNGITAFYCCHINSVGVSWHGFQNNNEWKNLYFEGCTTTIRQCNVMPTLMTYGGSIIAEKVTTAGLRLSYSPAKLEDITINCVEGVNNIGTAQDPIYAAFVGIMCNIVCKNPITINGESIINRIYNIDSCDMLLQKDVISNFASGVTSVFARTTIKCTDETKDELGKVSTLISSDCIWECEYEDLLQTKKLSAETEIQSNYTLGVMDARSRCGAVDIYVTVSVNEPVSSWTTVATLPAGLHPPLTVYKDVPYWNVDNTAQNIRLRITTSGAVQLWGGTAGLSYAFHDLFLCA